jgi:hypothetical protein
MSVHESVTPATSGQAIDLSAADWTSPGAMRSLLVSGAGNVTGRLAHDVADVVYPVQSGYNPLRFTTIRKTGTTATGLVGLF